MVILYELKKILLAPVIVGFILACLLVNVFIVVVSYEPSPDTSSIPQNIFQEYDAAQIAETYSREGYESHMIEKYSKLQPVIDQKSADGDALSYYFGENTYYYHGLLFGTFLNILIGESCVIALFITLLAASWENAKNTEATVYSTKTGRSVLWRKLAAALASVTVIFVVTFAIGLLVFLAKFDFYPLLDDNISSSFNAAANESWKPFITWTSFTVAGYLWATIGAAFALTLVFALLGFAVGAAMRNGHGAILAAIVICFALFMLPKLFDISSVPRAVLGMSPVWLWRRSVQWFTDGSKDILWANFECVGLAAALSILTLLSGIAAKIFKKRELL
jgi:hypothetical protein